MKTTVIYHSADFDGIFCREIARKFLPDAELIGWDFKDAPLAIPDADLIYVMDLPVDRVFGCAFPSGKGYSVEPPEFLEALHRIIWIDHHKSSIDTHPASLKGYRIDGVAACRLVWQWFKYHEECTNKDQYELPEKSDFVGQFVSEPLAVRLAGEYDIWDKRDPRAELFQHGLRSQDLSLMWSLILAAPKHMPIAEIEALMDAGHPPDLRPDGTVDQTIPFVELLLRQGEVIQYVRAQEYADVITQQGFDVEFHGIKFLACNSHELDIRSHLFEAGIKPHHEALMGFTFNGKDWRVSLYRIHGKETDILSICKLYGGGGHQGACGFRKETLPFVIGDNTPIVKQ